jgi:hypothetical protein
MVLVWRLLTDPPRPVVKVRILRSIRVLVSLGDSEKVPERNEMRAARTAQHQQKKSVSTWVVGTASLEIWCSWQVCRLWRDSVVFRVAVGPQCLVVHLSALVCTHTHVRAHTPSLLSFLLLSNNFFLPVLVAPSNAFIFSLTAAFCRVFHLRHICTHLYFHWHFLRIVRTRVSRCKNCNLLTLKFSAICRVPATLPRINFVWCKFGWFPFLVCFFA